MGENYATLAVNLACFAYENLFLKETCGELVALRIGLEEAEKRHRRTRGSSAPSASLLSLRKNSTDLLDLVKTLTLPRRVVDGRLKVMLGNVHFPPYIYDLRSTAGGTSGLYPTNVLTASGRIVPFPFEIETVCPAGLCVHYPDFLLEIDVQCKRLFTSLYDKREGRPEFEGIANFPHFEWRLRSNIKFRVVVCQLVRFARRCTRMHDFVKVVSNLLIKFAKHNYPLRSLWRRTFPSFEVRTSLAT